MFVLDGNFAPGLWAWNGLPLNTHMSMYATTNRCYKERGSRTNYVLSGFGDLGVACRLYVPKFAGSKPAEAVRIFQDENNPQRAFLSKGK